MQLLWSRAGQARHCGCRACNQAMTNIGRRATTKATRRKPTFAEVFTACYSSVFASAALVDAIRKEDRKQDLDQQLQEAKRELDDLRSSFDRPSDVEMQAESSFDTTPLRRDQMTELYQSIRTFCQSRPFMKELKNPVSAATSVVTDMQRPLYRTSDEDTLKDLGAIDYDALQEALIAEQGRDDLPELLITERYALENRSRRVLGLVKRLLREAHRGDDTRGTSETYRDLKSLLKRDYPCYSFAHGDPTRAKETLVDLHSSLRTTIATPDISILEKITRVCYNLLICPYAPDMHTYNTLVAAFDKEGLYPFANNVVWSFQYRENMVPTPLTYVTVLNHYKEAGMVGNFIHGMSVISGSDMIRGARIGSNPLAAVMLNHKLHAWACETDKRSLSGDTIFEHLPIHGALAETVMQGLLHFRMLDMAASFFLSCVRAGVSLGSRATRHLFEALTSSLYWKASVGLLQGLVASDGAWLTLLESGERELVSEVASRVYTMLSVCGIYEPGRPPSQRVLDNLDISRSKLARFLQDLDEACLFAGRSSSTGANAARALRRPHDLLTGPQQRLVQLESMGLELSMSKSTVISLERKMLRLEPEDFRVLSSTAHCIGDLTIANGQRLTAEIHDDLNAMNRPYHELEPAEQAEPEDLPWSSKRTWLAVGEYDQGKWLHDSMKSIVGHKDGLDKAVSAWADERLEWLDQLEAETAEAPRSRPRTQLPDNGFYWEGKRLL